MRNPAAVTQIDVFLAARLRAEVTRFPDLGSDVDTGLVGDRIRRHGIALALSNTPAGLDGFPPDIREQVRDDARLQAFWEESHAHLLRRMLSSLDKAGIDSLIFKGTGLAYSVYQDPAERRRGDSDLLVRRTELRETRRCLAALGLALSADSYLGQETWTFDTGGGFIHAIDLHWEIVGPPALRGIMTNAQCFDRAVPLPRLDPVARTLDPVFALLRGTINHALHGLNGYAVEAENENIDDRLIWRMDTHLLVGTLAPKQWDDLRAKACQCGLSMHLLQDLQRAQAAFGTLLPDDVVSVLAKEAGAGCVDRYLSQASARTRFVLDLRACRHPADAGALLGAHLFPGEQQMRDTFPDKAGWPLAILYLYRLVRGGWKAVSGQRG